MAIMNALLDYTVVFRLQSGVRSVHGTVFIIVEESMSIFYFLPALVILMSAMSSL